MSLTGLVRPLFAKRWRELEKHNNHGEQLQRDVLTHLLAKAKETDLRGVERRHRPHASG